MPSEGVTFEERPEVGSELCECLSGKWTSSKFKGRELGRNLALQTETLDSIVSRENVRKRSWRGCWGPNHVDP